MRKILISERQLNFLTRNRLMKEAILGGYETASGSTNKSPILHADLKKYGLKVSPNEFINYRTTIGELYNLSKGPESMYLSSFVPNENVGRYTDYISVGSTNYEAGDPKAADQTPYKSGTYVSGLINENDVVVASHNGLLAIQRVMLAFKTMEKLPKTIRVVFGTSFEDKDAQKAATERRFDTLKVEIPDAAYTLGAEFQTISAMLLCYLDMHRKSSFCNSLRGVSNNHHFLLESFINNVISGSKFLPVEQKEKIGQFLSSRGFITKVKIPEIESVFTSIIEGRRKLSSDSFNDPDIRREIEKRIQGTLSLVNENVIKIQQIVAMNYVNNLKKYIEVYFAGDMDEEMQKVNSIKHNFVPANAAYINLFKNQVSPTRQELGLVTQTSNLLPKEGSN